MKSKFAWILALVSIATMLIACSDFPRRAYANTSDYYTFQETGLTLPHNWWVLIYPTSGTGYNGSFVTLDSAFISTSPYPGSTGTWDYAACAGPGYTCVGGSAACPGPIVSVGFTASPVTAFVSPAIVTVGIGKSQTFTCTASGGLPGFPYTFEWFLNGSEVSYSGQLASSSTWTFTQSSTGVYLVSCLVTADRPPPNSGANYAITTVSPASPLTVSVTPSSVGLDWGVGASQTFVCTVSGGTSPYTFEWYANSSGPFGTSVGTSGSWTFTPPSTGIYYVSCSVTDSANPANSGSNYAIVIVSAHYGGGGGAYWRAMAAGIPVWA